MSQCKWRNKKGFFLQLTVNGVCEDCHPIIFKNVVENKKKFDECVKELIDSIAPNTV